jgi:hypothetical protein
MVGDVFDFSISSYAEAYSAAKLFFDAVQNHHLANDIFYIPGNHDGDFWRLADHEINVIKRIRNRQPPGPLQRAMPAVIDDREAGVITNIFWPWSPKLDFYGERGRGANRDGLFLDKLFDQIGTPPRFWVAYPNLYLVTRKGKCIIITHGHYFETWWAMAGELAVEIADRDLQTEIVEEPHYGKFTSLQDMVGMNFPLNQLAGSGIGQAEPLTKAALKVQKDVKARKTELLDKYLQRLPRALINTFNLSWKWGELVKGFVKLAKCAALREAEKYKAARNDKDFLNDPAVQKRFGRFYLASRTEIEAINQNPPYQQNRIPCPWQILFGHTHEPTPWDGGRGALFPKTIAGVSVTTFNTGGWLEDTTTRKVKAEVFIYESASDMRSVRIE